MGCSDCNYTGKIRFKSIESGMTLYSWLPWEEKECHCVKWNPKNKKKLIRWMIKC